MNISKFRYLCAIAFLLALLTSGSSKDFAQTPNENGKLVVFVTWGDVNNTPATDAYIEAHGFVLRYNSDKSFVLQLSRAGRYEAQLPSGVYDVFVSEGTSVPACKRVLIKAETTTNWTLKLETDYVYTDK
jgi:hypothetical protein